MTKYVAFLRAINVGGKGVIKMADLARIFTRMGLKDVHTYIQSGNVICQSVERDAEKLAKRIEQALRRKMGYEVAAMVRTEAEVRAVAKSDPFRGHRLRASGKFYVAFLREKPQAHHARALEALNSDIELYKVKDRNVFVVFTAEKRAKLSFSGNAVEKVLGVQATGRNHNVVQEIAELLGAPR
jgi:uncharacterized protein (DUF1697 family)